MKRALITGITGQDGAYLASLLVGKGYKVYGMCRRSSVNNRWRLKHIEQDIEIISGDMTCSSSIRSAIEQSRPDEIYNLAAQSHVGESFKAPCVTFDINAVGLVRIMDAARDIVPRCKIYQACTSEMFGNSFPYGRTSQDESTPLDPRSPYAVAKVAAYNMAKLYREAYGMFICCGILFNHESPLRGEDFVTRKITMAVGAIKRGEQDKLYLGNLDAQRDWGFAGDYVIAMHMMMQAENCSDYVIATGETHSVREFCELAFGYADLDYKDYVEVDPKFYRPAEVARLIGDSTKAATQLGWKPRKNFAFLVKNMVEHDMGMHK